MLEAQSAEKSGRVDPLNMRADAVFRILLRHEAVRDYRGMMAWNVTQRPFHVKELQDVHGITRARLAQIFRDIESQRDIPVAELDAVPSILQEVRNNLRPFGITERVSYQDMVFGYHEFGRDRRGKPIVLHLDEILPHSLQRMVLGREMKYSTRETLAQSGDRLYGPLNREALRRELRNFLAQHGYASREAILQASKPELMRILKSFRISGLVNLADTVGHSPYEWSHTGYVRASMVSKDDIADMVYPLN